jgi:rRNA maturation endonuclease Nob1
MENDEFNTYIYHFKCRACQLEFALYSWENDWADKNKPFCPECGKQDTFFQIKKTSQRMISNLVYDEKI